MRRDEGAVIATAPSVLCRARAQSDLAEDAVAPTIRVREAARG